MPYDIHLAETEAEATESLPELSIAYKVHQRIFAPELELWDLTLFYHLSDFYQDARFIDGDVVILRGEVEQARKRVVDPKGTEALSRFAKVCEKALKKRLNIFVFSG